MPHAKRPSAGKNARRAAQKLAALKQSGPLIRRLHSTGTIDCRRMWPWPPAPPTPAMSIAMRISIEFLL